MREIKYIFEDEDLLVCHKPAGIATEGARVGNIDLISAARNYLKRKNRDGKTYLATVHRLDQPVEGVVVLAKTKKAAGDIARQIKEHTTDKYYYALCYGRPDSDTGKLTDFLVKKEDGLAKVISEKEKDTLKDNVITLESGEKIRVADQDVKLAKLEYSVIAGDDKVSLLRIKLLTGRFHQIRVQLSSIGHPIMGEKKYGSPESMALSEELGISQMCLVSFKFALTHPHTGKRMEFEIIPDNINIKKWIK